jgi:LytS/YehU family sensor histidine kinase
MILLPLVDCALAGGAPEATPRGEVRLMARILGGCLVVEIIVHGRNPAATHVRDVLPDIRERLRALYGDIARLDVEPLADSGTRVVMEIPYESADRDHR